MTLNAIDQNTQYLITRLKFSEYPGKVDERTFSLISSNIEACLPEIFKKIEDRLHAGGFPVATVGEITQIFSKHPRLHNIPETEMMKIVKTVLPDYYPGTGFNLTTSDCEIRITKYGSPGPTPASVRAAVKSQKGADDFLTGRAGVNAKLHYICALEQASPYLAVGDAFFNLPDIKVSTVVTFLDVIREIAEDIAAAAGSKASRFDIDAALSQKDCTRFFDIIRPAWDVPFCGENHRLMAVLDSSHNPEHRRLSRLAAMKLYDVLIPRNILCLPADSRWNAKDHSLRIQAR